MKRRQFLKNTVIAGAVASFPAPAVARETRDLKMVTVWPRNLPGLAAGAERLAKRINDLSGGELNVKVFAAGELVPPQESFDAVASGFADMYHASEHYWRGKSRAYDFFSAVPFGMSATEMNAWLQFGGGQPLWDELSASFNLKPFQAGNTGGRMGGWFNKEINAVSDFSRLKISMSDPGGEVLNRFGAKVSSLPPGEIVNSLRSGAIDAVEWFGPWNDMALGLHQAAKYYYYPGFHKPGLALSAAVNLITWDKMPRGHQRLIETATAAENAALSAEFTVRNAESLELMVKEHKVKLRRFPDSALEAFGDASGRLVNEAAAGDKITMKIYKSFLDFRRKAIGWSRHSELAFGGARQLPFKYGE
ncbi:MAG: ABC transporter substrate-binding protein [Rhodospirillales bacterium RIFCSPLOWO2_12_FULL_58_28]|nr:MAG: ABC transporter substrate-binding protein [Rhodospirillales bacterium RIFCSPLOWO2_02_FULL_58_16]OHC77261.1 MAG: ABC transporter substrate-binding protein [Rhodospirillales bacterium RIFCSPLOWO2_12_FULL_58_28]